VIEVIDINDNSPTFEQQRYEIGLSEASASGTVIPLPIPSDLDGPKYGIKTYRIFSRYPEFELRTTSSSSGSSLPNLVLVGAVDRERVGSYTLTLAVIDGGTPPLTGTTSIVVVIEDVNDNTPVFESTSLSIVVAENESVSRVLIRATATDADLGLNAVMDYVFDKETQTIYGKQFSVDPTSGDVVLAQKLDYERQTTYRLVLLAVDRGSSPLTGQVILNIKVSVTYGQLC